jgi:hypothetical protein
MKRCGYPVACSGQGRLSQSTDTTFVYDERGLYPRCCSIKSWCFSKSTSRTATGYVDVTRNSEGRNKNREDESENETETSMEEDKTDRTKNNSLLHGEPDLAGAKGNANEK